MMAFKMGILEGIIRAAMGWIIISAVSAVVWVNN